MKNNFTLSIYSDNSPGLLHRITVLFTRRKLNIESLTVSETETSGISRFTIVVNSDFDTATKVAKQIRRIIEVHEVFVSRDEELVVREVAIFKVNRDQSEDLNSVACSYAMRTLHEHSDSIVLEMTGSEEDINQALKALSPFGVKEFVRSGRIGVRRDGVTLKDVMETPLEEPSEGAWI